MGTGEGQAGEAAPDSASLPLQQYKRGVIRATPATCDPHLVNHSVLLVGFGKSKSVEGRRPRPGHSIPYWILKNSWGPDWGEEVSASYCRVGREQGRTGLSPASGPDVP